ncbi:ABC transporter substrate-binding protein [Palleronia sp. LCG004]|uniref:ABC transporter substrate-binding protein n=1 Tax=Palleronia sp. LCG004 TaxID=3079304 RepID=UPI002943F208|nr:ABC transporter substrate-binding protein [Palleronia sp. LCG004]WOI57985.1 ABC transporter substrate-binding protein [Palleronia sp. LCG004]
MTDLPESANRNARLFLLLALATLLWVSRAVADPVEIAHRWGTTRIDAPPERVVSLSYTGVDYLRALGVTPIAYRAWYGGDADGLWPWTPPFESEQPRVLRGEIDLEAVARLEPDLIEAVFSGLTRAEYDALSRIAPVVAAPKGAMEFGATWPDMLAMIGAATFRPARAAGIAADLDARLRAIRDAHPGWQGKSAMIVWPDGPLIYGPDDPRMQLLARLGLVLPDAARELVRGGFYFRLDTELTAPLDADVLIWLDVGGGVAAARDLPLRGTLRAVAQGREVVADPETAAALSYATPLSIPFALDRLVPLIERAIDGDPATPVPGVAQAGLAR